MTGREMDRWEELGGLEIEGDEDSDGPKTGGKCRAKVMKRQVVIVY